MVVPRPITKRPIAGFGSDVMSGLRGAFGVTSTVLKRKAAPKRRSR